MTLYATEAIGSVCDADSKNYENIVIEVRVSFFQLPFYV
jgi:hypothetical protein